MIHGIINVYKERGYTSFDVVARMRGICGQRKVGHAGTLDPDAEGVLPLCLGNATKLCGMLTDRDKVYRAVLLLGVKTDTQDVTGNVIGTGDASQISEEMLRGVIESFVGDIMQIPPMYSAVKIKGKKLCDLARAGKTIDRPPRPVHIYKIDVLNAALPEAEIRVICSKGTYIRTLCHDIGEKLSCGAVMKSLVRLESAGFKITDSHRLSEIEDLSSRGKLDTLITPTDKMFSKYPALTVSTVAESRLKNGNPIEPEDVHPAHDADPKDAQAQSNAAVPGNASAAGSIFRMYTGGGEFCALYRYETERGVYAPEKMFFSQ